MLFQWYCCVLVVPPDFSPFGPMVSKLVLLPPQPCIITIVGNGPLPVGGIVTATSSGTPSKLGTRLATFPAQKRTPFCGAHALPRGVGSAVATAGTSADRTRAAATASRGQLSRRTCPD